MFDGLFFDPFSLFDYGGCPAEVGIGRRNVAQDFVIALVVVMLHERLYLGLQVPWQELVFQQDAFVQGLVPAFDLAWCLRMEGCAAHMAHLLCFDIFRQLACNIAGAII